MPDEVPLETEEAYDISSRNTPLAEEKKTEYESPDRHVSSRMSYRNTPEPDSPPSIKLQPRTTSHFSQPSIKEEIDAEMEDYEDEDILAAQAPRSSPVTQRIETVVEGTDAPDQVEDIAMSPIPLDREDPATLMQVPEDILTLPLSACGPNDDPLAPARQ